LFVKFLLFFLKQRNSRHKKCAKIFCWKR